MSSSLLSSRSTLPSPHRAHPCCRGPWSWVEEICCTRPTIVEFFDAPPLRCFPRLKPYRLIPSSTLPSTASCSPPLPLLTMTQHMEDRYIIASERHSRFFKRILEFREGSVFIVPTYSVCATDVTFSKHAAATKAACPRL